MRSADEVGIDVFGREVAANGRGGDEFAGLVVDVLVDQLRAPFVGGEEGLLHEVVLDQEDAPAVAVAFLETAVAVADVDRRGAVVGQELERDFEYMPLCVPLRSMPMMKMCSGPSGFVTS